jgi:hypothetical protein
MFVISPSSVYTPAYMVIYNVYKVCRRCRVVDWLYSNVYSLFLFLFYFLFECINSIGRKRIYIYIYICLVEKRGVRLRENETSKGSELEERDEYYLPKEGRKVEVGRVMALDDTRHARHGAALPEKKKGKIPVVRKERRVDRRRHFHTID